MVFTSGFSLKADTIYSFPVGSPYIRYASRSAMCAGAVGMAAEIGFSLFGAGLGLLGVKIAKKKGSFLSKKNGSSASTAMKNTKEGEKRQTTQGCCIFCEAAEIGGIFFGTAEIGGMLCGAALCGVLGWLGVSKGLTVCKESLNHLLASHLVKRGFDLRKR